MKRARKPFAVIRNNTLGGKPIVEGVAKLLRGLGDCRCEDNAFDRSGRYEVAFVDVDGRCDDGTYERYVWASDIRSTLEDARSHVGIVRAEIAQGRAALAEGLEP